MELSREQMHELTRLGARERLAQIRAEIAAVEALVSGADTHRGRSATPPPTAEVGRRPRRTLSAKGRAAIAAAQRARWAKIKAAKAATAKK